MDYLINMSCIGAVVDCFISAGLVLVQKWAVVSVGLVLGSGRLYHISRTSTATDIDCVVSFELVLGHWWTVSYQ